MSVLGFRTTNGGSCVALLRMDETRGSVVLVVIGWLVGRGG